MAAEVYFSDSGTGFNTAFQNQMQNGIDLVSRRDELRRTSRKQTGTANAALGEQRLTTRASRAARSRSFG